MFLYSVYYQSLSYLKRPSLQLNTITPLEPFYHPQSSQLSTNRQSEWWSYAAKLTLASTTTITATVPSSPWSSRPMWWDRPLDETICARADAKTLNELSKTLELIRLKSSSIKLGTSLCFRVNVRICAQLTKYLEYLSECLSQPTSIQRDFEDENIK